MREKLGTGGLATVYEVKHLVSNSKRALKVSHEGERAEAALLAEFKVLEQLDHPNIGRGRELFTQLIPGRRVMAMDRVQGQTLSAWLKASRETAPAVLRQYAENLFSALGYLEARGLLHKDLKPDNLIVGDAGLTVIDFSLVDHAPEETTVGTPSYRDPTMQRWDAEADRYAAALCLHELYTGRHPFDGRPPMPNEELSRAVHAEDFDNPGMRRFFLKALSAARSERFASAAAMRAFFLECLGVSRAPEPEAPPIDAAPESDSAQTPLAATRLSSTAEVNLRRAGIRTQGELAALTDAQLDSISGLGKKKREEIRQFRDELGPRLRAASAPAAAAPRPLHPSLEGNEADVHQLGLPARLAAALTKAGLVQVGRLASSTREHLTRLPGVGAASVEKIVQTLYDFESRGLGSDAPRSIGAVWEGATATLLPAQRQVLERRYGLVGEATDQGALVGELGLSQSDLSALELAGLERLDRRFLQPVLERIESQLSAFGGIDTLRRVAEALEAEWAPSEGLRTDGLLCLLARANQGRLTWMENPDSSDSALLLLPTLPEVGVRRFMEAARTAAGEFPQEPEASRRMLRVTLPEYELDPLALAQRILRDLRLTDSEHLYETPLDADKALSFVLDRERLPLPVAEVLERARRAFPDEGAFLPQPEGVAEVLKKLPRFKLDSDGQLTIAGGSLDRVMAPVGDALPQELRVPSKTPEQAVADRLRALSRNAGYRLVVSAPERHGAIGKSVAAALGVPFVSFERQLLEQMEPEFGTYEKAERYAAQRGKLRRAAEALFERLLREHGRPGAVTVLGDTGILGICDATHLVRRLYDATTERDVGFWVLVIPGIVLQTQPRFNEITTVFHMPEAVLPLGQPIPEAASSNEAET